MSFAEKILERAAKVTSKTRIEDLYRKTHRVGMVELPFVNAFGWDVLERYMNRPDAEERSESVTLGVTVYVFENQRDVALGDLSFGELEARGKMRIMDMAPWDVVLYQRCVNEILDVVKKKYIEAAETETELEPTSPDGERCASDCPNGSTIP